ncbi:hypothetical protein ACOJBO_01125 [Rhizobium beringeri]
MGYTQPGFSAHCRPIASTPITGGIEPAGSCNVYEVDRLPSLSEYAGRLWIDWGDSYRS